MRWTEEDLRSASPGMVRRLRWLLEAERIAKTADNLESVLAQKATDARGRVDHEVQFARARAADSLRHLDDYLMTEATEAELLEDESDG